jgi:hypothetical protein
MHARHYNPLVGRFLSIDPVMQTERASVAPQLWNRYSYALNNPMLMVDPTGEDVSIAVIFKTTDGSTDGWTEDEKQALVRLIWQFWANLRFGNAGVGNVYVFDAARWKHGGSGAGVATITVDRNAIGNGTPERVPAGKFMSHVEQPYLSQEQRLQAVANVVNHEIFSHQFGLVPREVAFLDNVSFAADARPTAGVSARYESIADSHAFNRAFMKAVSGPLPAYGPDLQQAVNTLSPVSLAREQMVTPRP